MPTDLHCHLLPGVDDGPETLEDAVALARAISASGVNRVVATPHVNHHFPTSSAGITAGVTRVRGALAEAGIALEVLPGAEVAASHLPDLDPAHLPELALGSGTWLLLEPPIVSEFAFEEAVELVLRAGLRPLVAHPERCGLFQRAPERLPALVAAGAALSVTAASLTGGFGRPAQQLARALVADHLVANVSSDAHGVARRPPRLLHDLFAAGLADSMAAWCDHFPAEVLGAPSLTLSIAAADRPSGLDPVPPPPSEVASNMMHRGAQPKDVERFLLAQLSPAVAQRTLRRLLRQHPTP